jgi:methionyl-tRNA formyltransferase
MKIGFFGTPEIAAQCLEYLAERFTVVFSVSCEDKPQGRNLRVCQTPVKDASIRLGIPVLQPASIKDPLFAKELAAYGADIFVVIAYGKIIPRAVFAQPRLGSINLHPSLLPLYRGAAPVEWAVRSGDAISGVTVQYINERLDAGDIVLQKEIAIGPDMTSGELFDTAIREGQVMLESAIRGLDDGSIYPVPQEESKATHCGKIMRETAHVDWNDSASSIHNLVRAFNPKPLAWSFFRGRNIHIIKTKIVHDDRLPLLAPGEIAVYAKKRLLCGTGTGCIEILELQPETKKAMDAVSFINGQRLVPGERWES